MDKFPFSTTWQLFIIFACIAIAVMVQVLFLRKKKKVVEKPVQRRIMTPREQKMYFVLKAALPELIVFTQVSFCALITAKSFASRATFNRKFTDFVVCDYDLNVLVIIELDDWSHQGNEQRDADRDKLLADAGYQVVRFEDIPEPGKVRSEIRKQVETSSRKRR
ncbi:hypothetical protein CUZ56_00460 [Saezia sanguinis]|jgi:very-short-patch-repair endonuclease|uniref:DUF2726 domain-containing protein n=1 Tax=Saezia sanguinis TaxID=1965230 RepID=A0A433SGU4_9BURK|nr:DUF2726 domain-containing protein [Saezia sanguinis]RUS67977.1 hypothetical protein CUZ56_00460 [Saezia sanguinis]